jgi:hypothetical protein
MGLFKPASSPQNKFSPSDSLLNLSVLSEAELWVGAFPRAFLMVQMPQMKLAKLITTLTARCPLH